MFPHHENEIAQSRSAGYEFAHYWVHNGLVGVSGEKMSKSLGNSLSIGEMLNQVRPAELRYYLAQAHYRSPLEFSPDALSEAAAAYRRIEGFVTRAAELGAARRGPPAGLPDGLRDAGQPARGRAAAGLRRRPRRRSRRPAGARGRARRAQERQQRARCR